MGSNLLTILPSTIQNDIIHHLPSDERVDAENQIFLLEKLKKIRNAKKSDSFTVPPLWPGQQHRFLMVPSSMYSSSLQIKKPVHRVNFRDMSRRKGLEVAKAQLARGLEKISSRERLVVNDKFNHSQLSKSVLNEFLHEFIYKLAHSASLISTAVQGEDAVLASNLRREKDDLLLQMNDKLRSLGVAEADIIPLRSLLLSSDKVYCVKQKVQQEMIKTKKKKKEKKSKLSVFLL